MINGARTDMPLVSVVIPVYNVETYVVDSVHSVTSQTYRNLEIILVDDGSTDRSSVLCRDLANSDDRITLVRRENGGLSAARNTGIDIACGDYIFFLDSDDRIDLNTIQYLLDEAVENACDIAMVGFRNTYNHTEELRESSVSNDQIYMSGYDAMLDALYKHNSSMHAWGKLYKRSLFEIIRYPEGRLYEDAGTTYRLLAAARKVSISSSRMVQYLKRPGSITGSNFNIKHMDAMYFAQDINNFVSKLNMPALTTAAEYYLFSSAIYLLDLMVSSEKSEVGKFNGCFKQCAAVVNSTGLSVSRDRHASFRMRLYGFLANINTRLPVTLLTIKNILKNQTHYIRGVR